MPFPSPSQFPVSFWAKDVDDAAGKGKKTNAGWGGLGIPDAESGRKKKRGKKK